MRTLFYKLGLFIVFFLIGNFILHYAYKSIISSRIDNGRKEIQFENYDDELKFLFLGDSHIQNAINPKYINSSFNYSSALENYVQTYYKLVGINEKLNRKPEYIVLPVDLTSFSSFRSERFKNLSGLLGFSEYLEMAIEFDDYKFLTYWLENKALMYAGKYETIFRYISSTKKKNTSNMYLGFKGRKGDLTMSEDYENECSDKAKLYLGNKNHLDPILLKYFERTLSYCDQNDIKVILIRMPLADKYQKACNNIFNVDGYNQRIDNISSRHKSVTLNYDFRNYFRIDQSNFRNPDHLSIKGSESFSKMIGQKLNKM